MGKRGNRNKSKQSQQATWQAKAPDAVPDVPLPPAAGDSNPAVSPLPPNKSEAAVKSAAGPPAKTLLAGEAADSSQPSDVTRAPAAPVDAPAAPSTPTGTSTSTTPETKPTITTPALGSTAASGSVSASDPSSSGPTTNAPTPSKTTTNAPGSSSSSSSNAPMSSSSTVSASANASEATADVTDAVVAAASSVMGALDAPGTNQAVMEDSAAGAASSSQAVSGTATKLTDDYKQLPLVETEQPAAQPAVQPAAAGDDLAAAATPAPQDSLQEDKASDQQQQQDAPAQPSPLLAARSSSINRLSIAGGSLSVPPTAADAEPTGPFGTTSTTSTTPDATLGAAGDAGAAATDPFGSTSTSSTMYTAGAAGDAGAAAAASDADADANAAHDSSTSIGRGGVMRSEGATGPEGQEGGKPEGDAVHLLQLLRAGEPVPDRNSSSTPDDVVAADGPSTSTPLAAEVPQGDVTDTQAMGTEAEELETAVPPQGSAPAPATNSSGSVAAASDMLQGEVPGAQARAAEPAEPGTSVPPSPAPVPAFSDRLVISTYPGSPAVVHTSSSMSTAAPPGDAAAAGVTARSNLFPKPTSSAGGTARSNLMNVSPQPAAAPTLAVGAPDATMVTTYMYQPLSQSEAAATTAATTAATDAASSNSSSSLKPFPPQLLPAVGTTPELTQQHMQALSVWYTKFCADSEEQQVSAIKQYCVPGMIFEDNFIKVWNTSLVAVQFAALKRVTGAVQLLPEKVEVLPSPPGAPTYTLRIVSRIAFGMWDWKRHLLLCMVFPPLLLLPGTLESWVTDEVTVRAADNMFLSYKQRVHNIPTAPTLLRAIFGLFTSWLFMMLLGW